MSTIRIEDVSLLVQGRPVLERVTATIQSGHLTCLLGTNGAGKTMLLRVLSGEMPPTTGRILMNDTDVSNSSRDIIARTFAIVPQGTGDPPYLTVQELVNLGRFDPARRFWKRFAHQDRALVAECMTRCQVVSLADRPVWQLSGGEKQRAWLAFALAQSKQFLLLDEALGALDFSAKWEFFSLVADVAAEGRGVVLVTHDVDMAKAFADTIVVMADGRVAYKGPPSRDLDDLLLVMRG